MALPLILSNITTPLLGLSNTTIAGHLSNSDYLAAIGLGAMIFNFIYWGLGFFRMSSTGLIARAYGAKNFNEINNTLLHSISLAIIIGLGLILLQYPLYKLMLFFIHPNIEVSNLLKTYYLIRIWGAPAVLVNFVLVGTMVAIQKPHGPLLLLFVTNLFAILFSVILVFIFNLNIRGIAIADIVAQYIGLGIGMIVLSQCYNLRELLQNTQISILKFKKLLHANRDIFVRTLGIIIAFSLFTIWSSKISPLVLAVNTLLLNFFQIMANTLGGFDNVAEALAGEAIGKDQLNLFKKTILDVGIWVLLVSLLFTAIYFLWGQNIINFMSNIKSIRDHAYHYLPYVTLLPIICFMSFLFDGLAIGANLFKEMRNSMLLTLLLFFLVWISLKDYGNVGLWLTFYSFFIFRAIFLGWYLLKYCNSYKQKSSVNQ